MAKFTVTLEVDLNNEPKFAGDEGLMNFASLLHERLVCQSNERLLRALVDKGTAPPGEVALHDAIVASVEADKRILDKMWASVDFDAIRLARIMAIQATKNEGRGVSCVRTVIAHIQRGDVQSARAAADTDHDKIRNYPDIESLLKTALWPSGDAPKWWRTK